MSDEIISLNIKNPSKVRLLQQVILDGINAKIDEGTEVDPVDLALSLGVLLAENCGLAVQAGSEWISSRRDEAYYKLPPKLTGQVKGGLRLQ